MESTDGRAAQLGEYISTLPPLVGPWHQPDVDRYICKYERMIILEMLQGTEIGQG